MFAASPKISAWYDRVYDVAGFGVVGPGNFGKYSPSWQTPSVQTFKLPFASMPRSHEKLSSEILSLNTRLFLWIISHSYKQCLSNIHTNRHTHVQTYSHLQTHMAMKHTNTNTICILKHTDWGCSDYADTPRRIRSKPLYRVQITSSRDISSSSSSSSASSSSSSY